MKKIIIATVLTSIVHIVFGQRVMDPSYAPGNYKHPNKAAYAKEHGINVSTALLKNERTAPVSYKTPFSNQQTVVVAEIAASPNAFASSYKHPQGLMNSGKKNESTTVTPEVEVIASNEIVVKPE